MAAALQTHFERREFKFFLDGARVARVREMIRPFCELDPFAASQPDNKYSIESIYFDTPNLGLYRANELEVCDRYKLRVRSYPDVEGSPAFFEVKRRYHDVIVKDRAKAPADWARAVQEPGWFPGDSEQGRMSPAAEAFLARVRAKGCRPVCTVDYQREAWASTVDDYARVTFDGQIRCQQVSSPRFGDRPGSWTYVDHAHASWAGTRSWMVLELKFTRAVPSWMMNIVRTLDLSRAAFSKYGRSVEGLSLGPRHRVGAVG